MVSDGAFRNALIDKAEREAEAEVAGNDATNAKPDFSSLSAAQTEQTRALRKKLELQQKLKQKQDEEEKRRKELDPEAAAREEAQEQERKAGLVAEAIKKIEEESKESEAPAKSKVKVGNKMVVTSEGNLSKEESVRLQSAVGTGMSSKLKAFFQLEGQTRDIGEDEVKADEVISFCGCKNCDFTISTMCTKVFVERCEDFILRINGKILTETVEIDASERMNLLVYNKIGTLQVERCSKMNLLFQEKAFFSGFMIWAGCFMLRLQVEESVIKCDFGLTQKLDPTINIERTQFKVWLNSQGKLTCDKVIRLKNGFPSTKREDDEHTRREEAKLQELATRMGVTIHRKEETIGGRVKPNEPCPCGSGKKFKKCCQSTST
eukprot:TRINITY_DN55226_c0_g1_i1.p1 TRINITY_DN55226_c0_g1~~TRINITY_DN55226_c0_g1_i1.p1  ORF type:complete len:378 (-),score=81.52 TRINITY_DN55226_c0_g1_i1:151-1284(-)